MAKIQAIKGFADLFADESRLFTFLEESARTVFARYGFTELRTPLMEFTDLFFMKNRMAVDLWMYLCIKLV